MCVCVSLGVCELSDFNFSAGLCLSGSTSANVFLAILLQLIQQRPPTPTHPRTHAPTHTRTHTPTHPHTHTRTHTHTPTPPHRRNHANTQKTNKSTHTLHTLTKPQSPQYVQYSRISAPTHLHALHAHILYASISATDTSGRTS